MFSLDQIDYCTDNFWEFFDEKWDYGDQIRICDGMLYSTMLHHLESLKANRIVDSMVILDYDEEPQSGDKYGTPLQGRAKVGQAEQQTINPYNENCHIQLFPDNRNL